MRGWQRNLKTQKTFSSFFDPEAVHFTCRRPLKTEFVRKGELDRHLFFFWRTRQLRADAGGTGREGGRVL